MTNSPLFIIIRKKGGGFINNIFSHCGKKIQIAAKVLFCVGLVLCAVLFVYSTVRYLGNAEDFNWALKIGRFDEEAFIGLSGLKGMLTSALSAGGCVLGAWIVHGFGTIVTNFEQREN